MGLIGILNDEETVDDLTMFVSHTSIPPDPIYYLATFG